MKPFLFSLLVTLSTSPFVFAQVQEDKYFDRYSTASGLSHNNVVGLVQDSTGFIWVGTMSGLNKFNGSRFVQFHADAKPNALPAEIINDVTKLDDHRIAVYTTGLHIIETTTGQTRNVFIPYRLKQYEYKFNVIERALGGTDGDLFVLTRSGFYHFDANYKLIFRFDYYADKDVPFSHFFFGHDLFRLNKNELLVSGVDGLYAYNIPMRKLKKMTGKEYPLFNFYIDHPEAFFPMFQPKPGIFFAVKPSSDSAWIINCQQNKRSFVRLPFVLSRDEIHYRSRLVHQQDSLYFLTGHWSGFYRLQLHEKENSMVMDGDKKFSSYFCNSFLTDHNGDLWIGTNKGLLHENKQKQKIEIENLPTAILNKYPTTRLDDVYADDEKVYAGSKGGAGLFVFNKKDLSLEKQVSIGFADVSNYVTSVIGATGDQIVLGTNGPLVFYNRRTGDAKINVPREWHQPYDWASEVYKGSGNKLWIGSRMNYTYDLQTQKFTVIPSLPQLLSVPFSMAEDSKGNIWMSGHGVGRYNVQQKKYDVFIDSFPYIRMPDKQVNSLVTDDRDRVWFNTNNNGLVCYDPVSQKSLHFTRTNGLPDDNVTALIRVKHQLWISCYTGVACLDLHNNQIRGFGKEDGFPDMPVVKGAKFFYDSAEQKLYLGFESAVVRFNPDALLQKNRPPKVFVETIVASGNNAPIVNGKASVSWYDNDLAITVGTVNFIDGSAQNFAYRIVKQEASPWIYTGKQSSFSISGLSPGTHILEVKVYSPDHRWSDQVQRVELYVIPPFWLRTWFLISVFALLMLGIYLLIKWRTSLAKKKEAEKTKIEQLKAADYKNRFELEHISNYFSSSLADKRTKDEVLWDVAENLIGKMNYEECIIYVWNENKTRMIQKAAYGPKGKPEFISESDFVVKPGQGIVGTVILTKQPELVADTRKDSRYRVDDQFRLSEICVPILHNGELLGIIDSEHSTAGYFSERDVNILTTVATLIANKLKQIESEQNLRSKRKELAGINEQLAEARLSALQAQMNPHFVFNALNSIKRMILDNDNDKASRYLSKFALMIRMTLDHSKNIFVTLEENIEYLRTYIEMEQLRFDDSFSYEMQISDEIDVSEISVPSMMLQPLVENAIWHGLMPSKGAKKLLLKFLGNGERITCIVSDTGIGLKEAQAQKRKRPAGHNSLGLDNLVNRITIMNEKYDLECKLILTDRSEIHPEEHGTKATLSFKNINVTTYEGDTGR